MNLLIKLYAAVALLVASALGGPDRAKAADRLPMPWPVKYLPLRIEGWMLRMAYIDLPARQRGAKVALLLHGKNFNAYYWREPAAWLNSQGYRVIIPDQLGFGNSDMPDIHYSFHQLAANTKALLDSLHIDDVVVIGHSMGGMLATRFCLMYPGYVRKLILEDPIGLEDYRRMVPFISVDSQCLIESKATYESYLAYQKGYYPHWEPRYDTLVRIQAMALNDPQFAAIAKANALTYDMIYQQPVCYEFGQLRVPTLLIVGAEDRTVVGKARIPEHERSRYGQYRELGKSTQEKIPGSKLTVLEGIGHIPHIQNLPMFRAATAAFLDVHE